MFKQAIKRFYHIIRVVNVVRANKGPYRFLVRNWERINDAEVASQVLTTDCFRDVMEPLPLNLDIYNRYLLLAPHQDDETIGAGGLMIKLKELGKSLVVSYITNGSQHIDGYQKAEVVNMRNSEALEALQYVNADVNFIGIDNINPVISRIHFNKLHSLISKFQPEVILLPWLLDTPVKHRLVNLFLLKYQELFGLPKKTKIWAYQVHNALIPNAFLDISDEIDTKVEMLKKFNSQNTTFQCYDHIILGMNAWNARLIPQEKFNISKRYAELFFVIPLIDYVQLIRKFYLGNINTIFKGDNRVIQSAESLMQIKI